MSKERELQKMQITYLNIRKKQEAFYRYPVNLFFVPLFILVPAFARNREPLIIERIRRNFHKFIMARLYQFRLILVVHNRRKNSDLYNMEISFFSYKRSLKSYIPRQIWQMGSEGPRLLVFFCSSCLGGGFHFMVLNGCWSSSHHVYISYSRNLTQHFTYISLARTYSTIGRHIRN